MKKKNWFFSFFDYLFLLSMFFVLLFTVVYMWFMSSYHQEPEATVQEREIPIVKDGWMLWNGENPETKKNIEEENRLGDMELLAQLAQAEAGNQGVDGMRFVISVVLNRVRSPFYPNTIEEVIFQPGQFGVTVDGAFERAAWNMSENAFKAVELEMEEQIDPGILYFNTSYDNGSNPFKYGAHWFSY